MDIHEYLGVLRRGLALIVLGTILGVGAGYAVQSVAVPTYSATSRELLTNKTAGDISLSQSRIASYVLVASSGLVLQPVIDQLGLDTSVDELATRLSVVAPPQTVVIEITATAATPQEAQAIANTVSDVFAEVVADQLETTSGALPDGTVAGGAAAGATPAPTATTDAAAAPAPAPTPSPTSTTLPDGTVVPIAPPTAPVRVVNLEQAALPTAPNASNGILMMLVGGVLGLALGLLLASLRQAFDRRVRSARDVAAVTDVPVIGQIAGDRAVWSGVLVARTGSRAAVAETFRALRAHLDHLRVQSGARSFVVTAAGPDQGATTITANLAVALANTATTVVVIDADLRGGALSRIFGVHGEPGLTEVLTQRIGLDAALQWGGTSGLTVLPAGSGPVNPGELLATPAMRELLVELRRRYEVVLIDSPTIAAVTDAAVLGSFDSATILVVEQGSSTRPKLDDAIAMLAAGGGAPIGVVLNSIPRRLPWRRRPAVTPAGRPAGRLAPDAIAGIAPSVVPVVSEVPAEPGAGVQPAGAVSSVPATSVPAQPVPAQPVPAQSTPITPAAPPFVATDVVGDRDPVVARRLTELDVRAAQPAPPARVAPAASAALSAPVFDPPLPAELQFVGVELPIGRRRPRHQADGVVPDGGAPADAAPESVARDSALSGLPAAEPAVDQGGPEGSDLHAAAVRGVLGDGAGASGVQVEADGAPAPEAAAPSDVTDARVVPPASAPSSPAPAASPSRFAPDLSRYAPDPSVYALARPPKPGTQGQVPVPPTSGTVVTTISVATSRSTPKSTTPPPPISRLLPITAEATTPPAEAADEADGSERFEREPEPVRVRPTRPGRPPMPPLDMGRSRSLAPVDRERARPGEPGVRASDPRTSAPRASAAHTSPPQGYDLDDATLSPSRVAELRAARDRALRPGADTDAMGSLLGEIGGVPRIEVVSTRPVPVADPAATPAHRARESYEQRSRELERAAEERLQRERQRLEVGIREQLAYGKRELESVLENRLEDTVVRPARLELPARRRDDAADGPADD